MLLNCYERLIYSLSILTTSNRKQAYPFLIPFGIGLFLGAASSMHLINYLLNEYRTPTLMFFYGDHFQLFTCIMEGTLHEESSNTTFQTLLFDYALFIDRSFWPVF